MEVLEQNFGLLVFIFGLLNIWLFWPSLGDEMIQSYWQTKPQYKEEFILTKDGMQSLKSCYE